MKQTLLIVLGSALITGAAIKAVPAMAQEPEQATKVSFVRTADLDLRSPVGQRQLDHRLANAAREVCGEASDVDVVGKNEVRRCRDETLAKANADRGSILAAAGRGGTIAITSTR